MPTPLPRHAPFCRRRGGTGRLFLRPASRRVSAGRHSVDQLHGSANELWERSRRACARAHLVHEPLVHHLVEPPLVRRHRLARDAVRGGRVRVLGRLKRGQHKHALGGALALQVLDAAGRRARRQADMGSGGVHVARAINRRMHGAAVRGAAVRLSGGAALARSILAPCALRAPSLRPRYARSPHLSLFSIQSVRLDDTSRSTSIIATSRVRACGAVQWAGGGGTMVGPGRPSTGGRAAGRAQAAFLAGCCP